MIGNPRLGQIKLESLRDNMDSSGFAENKKYIDKIHAIYCLEQGDINVLRALRQRDIIIRTSDYTGIDLSVLSTSFIGSLVRHHELPLGLYEKCVLHPTMYGVYKKPIQFNSIYNNKEREQRLRYVLDLLLYNKKLTVLTEQSIIFAIEQGYPAHAISMYNAGVAVDNEVLTVAIKYNNCEIVSMLLDKLQPSRSDLFLSFDRSLCIVERVIQTFGHMDYNILHYISKLHGRYTIFKLLRKHNLYDEDTLFKIALNDVELLKWMLRGSKTMPDRWFLDCLAQNNPDVLSIISQVRIRQEQFITALQNDEWSITDIENIIKYKHIAINGRTIANIIAYARSETRDYMVNKYKYVVITQADREYALKIGALDWRLGYTIADYIFKYNIDYLEVYKYSLRA